MNHEILRRCHRCLSILKEDGNCSNPDCVNSPYYKYRPDNTSDSERSSDAE